MAIKYAFKKGDILTSRFDQRKHMITKVFKTKIYWSENPDGTGTQHNATHKIVEEIFDFDVEKVEELKVKKSDVLEKKPLFLIMQQFWFDEILHGRKNIEYRENTPFYRSRLINKDNEIKNYSSVIMQVGYHKNAQRMTVEIEKIDLDDDYFEIYLGKIIDKNF